MMSEQEDTHEDICAASGELPQKLSEVVDKLDSDEKKVILQEQAVKHLEQTKPGSDKSAT